MKAARNNCGAPLSFVGQEVERGNDNAWMMAQMAHSGGLRIARDAYLRADYDACIAALRGTRSRERDFLLSRAYIRMGRPADAERVLVASRARRQSKWNVLMGAACSRQGDTARAEGYIDAALALAQTPEERAEARYQLALLRWMELRREEASAILAEGDFYQEAGLAEELRGWIAVADADYTSAVNYFENASKLASGDVMLECNVLRTACTFAREIYLPAVMSRVLHRIARVEWTSYLRVQRFHITRAAAWFEAIEGRYANAMQQFHELAALDVDEPWRLYPICDQAYLSLVLGEEINGWAIADEALTLANRIDWESCSGGESVGLLYVANIFALKRPIEAQRCWKLYKAVSPTNPMTRAAMAAEPSLEAWESYTAGLLEKGAGNPTAAAAHFNRAYSIYRRIGFEWRAVLTLIAQRDVTPDDGSYDEYIETVLRRFPNSWLRRLAEHERRRRGPVAVSSIA